ncbi:uncharacterized protein LOC123548818 isoform X3 [Mercenaria mercenaria]|uniref:uncharacterized protein LOC123548818 isoform X3 n=1 Tax=Mercenaria mercenaria TaxID=6596 RepID=UPI00234F44DF|nr:uncharacterized protein LOC123548818 isoform X3 [Mercenaria mercenaria]
MGVTETRKAAPPCRLLLLFVVACLVDWSWAQALGQNNINQPQKLQQQQPQQQQQQAGGWRFEKPNQDTHNALNIHGNNGQEVQMQQNGAQQQNVVQYQQIGNKVYSKDQLQMLKQNLQPLQNIGNQNQQPLQNLGSQNIPQNQQNINSQNEAGNNFAKNSDVQTNQQKDLPRKQKLDTDTVVSDNAGDPQKRISIEVRKDSVIGRVITDGADAGVKNSQNGETGQKNYVGENADSKDGKRLVQNADSGNNVRNKQETRDERGAFDVADLPKPLEDNAHALTGDSFDKKDGGSEKGGGIPDHVRIIDGDVEKNLKNGNNDLNEIQNGARGDSGIDNSVIRVPSIETNEIPRNVGNSVDMNRGQQKVNNRAQTNEEEKPGSLKVVWDWSDFAVNFEQYVMPEQKIRRAPHSTTGEPWPMPQYYVTKKDKVYRIDRASFRFDLSKIKCDIIERAIERYKPYVLEDPVEDVYDNFQHSQSTMFEDPSIKYDKPLFLNAPVVPRVLIKIRKPCAKYPTAKSDESYDLFVKRTGIHIWANEVWGALKGLETFSQLIFKGTNQLLYIRDTVINDYPRFSHRGLLIDSSRHFIFKETIYDVLEGMAQNKMNVLHWHIVDDQSFPFYSNAYPDLSAKGAFHPTFVYMPEDVADIIEYARLRGIRVEPEFDTPGHTYSWGLSRPDLLTQCYQGDRPVDGYLGPMDPTKNETFRFLKNFFKDVLHSFKDQYIHLGGDEVPMTCWQSNLEVTKFLAKLEGKPESDIRNTDPYYYSYDIRKVLEYYVTRLIKDLKSLGSKRSNGVRLVFWQEIMNNNVQLPNDTIIHVWLGHHEEIERAISLGFNVLYSSCWYINLIEYGIQWPKYYHCDPVDNNDGFNIDESKVLGGEACLWAEYIDNENLMTTLWPRASATAERLWSSKEVRDLDSAAARLQEHRCRMLSRGLGVGQISGPDYCLRRGKRRQNLNETASANCTYAQCSGYNEKSRVEVENIKVEFEQKGGRISDCSQAVLQAGGQLTLVVLLLILIAIAVTLTFTKKKFAQVRMCKNKTILMVFVTLILVYFMCYTSIWMQAMEFKGSFEKRISSNVQQT